MGQDSLKIEYQLGLSEFNHLFLSKYGIDYISDYAIKKKIPFRVVTHPWKTNTCYEKGQILGNWDPLNVIKALYFECSAEKLLYVIVIPETGCFFNKSYLAALLNLSANVVLAKAKDLPPNMTYGTCSPFITKTDLAEKNGKVFQILFDSEALVTKKQENNLDDFSFGLDHRYSIQLNYYHCYKLLKSIFRNSVVADDLLTLSFKEKLVRRAGKIKINYEFYSLNYRTAKFINSIHGYGDVSIVNDYIDELYLPEILTSDI
jgi:hypothetical protein